MSKNNFNFFRNYDLESPWVFSIRCLWINDEATLRVKFPLCSLPWSYVGTLHHVCSLNQCERWLKTIFNVVGYHTHRVDSNVSNMGVHLAWEMYLIDHFYLKEISQLRIFWFWIWHRRHSNILTSRWIIGIILFTSIKHIIFIKILSFK